MLFLQLWSATVGLIEAILWGYLAAKKSPAMTFEGIDRLKCFLNNIGNLNKWAAAMTGIPILLSAIESFLFASGRK